MRFSILLFATIFTMAPLASAAVRGSQSSKAATTDHFVKQFKARGSSRQLDARRKGDTKNNGMKSMMMVMMNSSSSSSSLSSSSSDDANGDEPSLFIGESVSIGGNGEGYNFAFVEDGEPVVIGVIFTGSSLQDLPTSPSDGLRDIRDADGNTVMAIAGHEYAMFYPEEIMDAISPFQHHVLNWNPDGHPPPEVYMIPHFDFHFYAYSAERRETCVRTPLIDELCPLDDPPFFANVDCDGLVFLTEPLPDDMMPPGYMLVPSAAESAMGNHLIPVGSVEFNGGQFTHTWVYGVEGGNITFYEPMVTIEYLEWLADIAAGKIEDPVDSNNGIIEIDVGFVSVSVTFPVPQAYPEAGMYPTGYVMIYDLFADEYSVALTDFKYFPQSSGVKNIPCPNGAM